MNIEKETPKIYSAITCILMGLILTIYAMTFSKQAGVISGVILTNIGVVMLHTAQIYKKLIILTQKIYDLESKIDKN